MVERTRLLKSPSELQELIPAPQTPLSVEERLLSRKKPKLSDRVSLASDQRALHSYSERGFYTTYKY
jgi:hypothetical protein